MLFINIVSAGKRRHYGTSSDYQSYTSNLILAAYRHKREAELFLPYFIEASLTNKTELILRGADAEVK